MLSPVSGHIRQGRHVQGERIVQGTHCQRDGTSETFRLEGTPVGDTLTRHRFLMYKPCPVSIRQVLGCISNR
jgi:hypothetical protein